MRARVARQRINDNRTNRVIGKATLDYLAHHIAAMTLAKCIDLAYPDINST